YNLQLQFQTLITLKYRGGYLTLTSKGGLVIDPPSLEKVLKKHQSELSAFTYLTFDLSALGSSASTATVLSDRSRLSENEVAVYGVLPSCFDATLDQFLTIGNQNKSTGLNIAEQLFTARGSQGVGVSSNMLTATSTPF